MRSHLLCRSCVESGRAHVPILAIVGTAQEVADVRQVEPENGELLVLVWLGRLPTQAVVAQPMLTVDRAGEFRRAEWDLLAPGTSTVLECPNRHRVNLAYRHAVRLARSGPEATI